LSGKVLLGDVSRGDSELSQIVFQGENCVISGHNVPFTHGKVVVCYHEAKPHDRLEIILIRDDAFFAQCQETGVPPSFRKSIWARAQKLVFGGVPGAASDVVDP
jgi:hypothetical protein